MTADDIRLNELAEACIAATDYDGAEKYVDETLKKNASNITALLTKAKIECSKGDAESVLRAIQNYKKALATAEASKEENLSRIRAGLHKAVVSAMYAACNDMLGPFGFEAYTRKKHFLTFTETLEELVNDTCSGGLVASNEVLKSMPMLLQKAATYIRSSLARRAEGSMEWLTEGTQYEDYKKSIDACIEIVDYSIDRETETIRKVRGYEKIISWLDARVFSATNEPTENANTGDTQYSLIESLSNPELEVLNQRRAEYAQSLETQKYIQALELLQERGANTEGEPV